MTPASQAPSTHRWTFTLADEVATQALGQALGHVLAPGEHLYLTGDLGAGKTTLSRSIAQSYGVADLNAVASPTYAYAHSYEGQRGLLHHLDFYRIDDEWSAIALGLEELLQDPKSPCIIEWAERIPALMVAQALRLYLHRKPGTTKRDACLDVPAARAQALAAALPAWVGAPTPSVQRLQP